MSSVHKVDFPIPEENLHRRRTELEQQLLLSPTFDTVNSVSSIREIHYHHKIIVNAPIAHLLKLLLLPFFSTEKHLARITILL